MMPVFDLGKHQVPPPHQGYFAHLYGLNGQLKVKVYNHDSKIGKFIIDEDYDSDLKNLSQISKAARQKIDKIITANIHSEFKIEASKGELFPDEELDELVTKTAQAKISESESDDEFAEPGALGIPPFLKRQGVSFIDMTVSCSDHQNIKGSTLIEIVHQKVLDRYEVACSLENPEIREVNGKNILFLQKPSDWFTSLGGWKGMMPRKEIQECKFFPGKKFDGVRIYNNGTTFPSNGTRILIGKAFDLCGIEITRNFDRRNSEVQRKSDLSYPQIIRAINVITRERRGFDDKKIAQFQLMRLINEKIKPMIPPNKKLEIFLDYLNGLMFGIEPSGLNAGLVTSLMTLALIKDGKLTYEKAFRGKKTVRGKPVYEGDFGGIYPFATHNEGGNKGTFIHREKVLVEGDTPISMKEYRDDPSMSPVAIKEATLIKYWLKHNRVLDQQLPRDQQIEAIEQAIDGLIKMYFFPGEAP